MLRMCACQQRCISLHAVALSQIRALRYCGFSSQFDSSGRSKMHMLSHRLSMQSHRHSVHTPRRETEWHPARYKPRTKPRDGRAGEENPKAPLGRAKNPQSNMGSCRVTNRKWSQRQKAQRQDKANRHSYEVGNPLRLRSSLTNTDTPIECATSYVACYSVCISQQINEVITETKATV